MEKEIKVNMVYDPFDYDEKNEAEDMVKMLLFGNELLLGLAEFEEEMRSLEKYHELTDDEYKMLDNLRTKYYEILNDTFNKIGKE